MSEASDEETEVGVLVAAKDRLIKPLHSLTTKPAQRTYLNTLLLITTSSVLLIVAISAYLIFYFSYIPDLGFSRPIFLQFGPDHAPYGNASIKNALVSFQRYDVKVVLHMPRTPSNKAAGNFMVDLKLLAPTVAGMLDISGEGEKSSVLGQASRPAILTYHSTTMEQVHRAWALPLHLAGWREEAESLNVKMIEGIEFPKGWRNIPDQVRLELRSAEKLQVYNAKVEFTARLRGLRYMMYNFRLLSFLVLTTSFWSVEMAFAAIVWLSLSSYLSSSDHTPVKTEDTRPPKQESRIKEEEDISDTPHTFPTLSGQPPLHYSSPHVKEENKEQEPPELQHAVMEADDEDEDADYVLDDLGGSGRGVSDSGIGTSMESSGGRPISVRRRKSRTAAE